MIKKYEIEEPESGSLAEPYPVFKICRHQKKKYIRIEQRDQSVVVKQVCYDCGHTDNAVKKSSFSQTKLESMAKRTVAQIHDFRQKRETIKRVEYQAEIKTWEEKKQRCQEKHNALWWEWYSKYLESDNWEEKRQKVLKRANFVCESCLDAKATQVHHKTYEHVGEEPLYELVAVCKSCHDGIHLYGESNH